MRVALLFIVLALLFALPVHAQSPVAFANPVVYSTSGWSCALAAPGRRNLLAFDGVRCGAREFRRYPMPLSQVFR